MNFYEVSYSTDVPEMGMIPQISYYEIEGRQRPYDSLITFHSFAGAGLKFKGNMKLDAKFTDLMVCPGLSTGKGLLVSSKFRQIISKYNLPDCTIYNFDISDAGEITSYYYMHVVFCYEIKQKLDYHKSQFYINHDKGKQTIAVDSWDDWWKKNQQYVESNLSIIDVAKLVFTGDNKDLPGVIRLPFSSKICIAEQAKKQIESSELTGFTTSGQVFEMITS